MEDGLRLVTGQNVQKFVEEDSRLKPEPALTPLLHTMVSHVRDPTPNHKIATHKCVQLTVGGLLLAIGQYVLLVVGEDLRLEPEPALILLLLMVEMDVREQTPSHKVATHRCVQLTVSGLLLAIGQNVLLFVGEGPRLEPEPVLILLLLMAEMDV